VLPNEIIISFAPGTSETQKQQVLNEQNLETQSSQWDSVSDTEFYSSHFG
jgi:hypothetical protein